MADNFAKSMFPSQYSKLEHLRQNAKSRPLTMEEINVLLSMYFNNEPMFESIDTFYTEEYALALKNGTPAIELEKMAKFRVGTDAEINLLYSDIHTREDKIEISGGQPAD